MVDADGELTQEEIDEVYERYKRVDFVKVDENDIDEWYGMGGEIMSHLLFYDTSNNLLFETFESRYARVSVYLNKVLNDYRVTNL